MIGPNGVGKRRAGHFITAVRATDRDVRVSFGSDLVGSERVVVELRLGLEGGVEPVAVRLSGTGISSIPYMESLTAVLGHATEVGRELEGIAADRTSWWWHDLNPEITKGIIAGRSDYMLCAYLILNGVGAFYIRGEERNEEQIGRGLHDLEALRATALRLLNEKVEVRD